MGPYFTRNVSGARVCELSPLLVLHTEDAQPLVEFLKGRAVLVRMHFRLCYQQCSDDCVRQCFTGRAHTIGADECAKGSSSSWWQQPSGVREPTPPTARSRP